MLELFNACDAWLPDSITIHDDKSFSALVIFKFKTEAKFTAFIDLIDQGRYDESAFIEHTYFGDEGGDNWELTVELIPQNQEQKREVWAHVYCLVRALEREMAVEG
jgi:hypothetical protein